MSNSSDVTCEHLGSIQTEGRLLGVAPSGDGCVECLRTGGRWVHLRRCLECGHVGCCDSSPNRHATAHFHEVGHPLVQSFEPGEDWVWCYADDVGFELPDFIGSPSHP
jgi:uncharacterized UBP type Zn finger protein